MRKVITWLVILFFYSLVFIPLYWIIISSFKTNPEFFSKPFNLPSSFSLHNYKSVFYEEPMMLFLANSIIVSIVSTLAVIVIAMFSSYVFLYHIPLKKFFFYFISFGIFLPLSSFMLPYFLIINWLRLYDTVWGIALVYTGISLPLGFLIINTYMKESILQETIEAAYIDGASFHQVFFRIVAPQCKGGMMTAAVFLLLTAWNELLYALLLTQREVSRTVQVAIRFFIATFAANYPQAFAAMMIAILPMIIIYIFLNKQIVAGLGLSLGMK
jgi:raffinose/stachyose/melibiose transport system permease protein